MIRTLIGLVILVIVGIRLYNMDKERKEIENYIVEYMFARHEIYDKLNGIYIKEKNDD